jgi:hypothetical protein
VHERLDDLAAEGVAKGVEVGVADGNAVGGGKQMLAAAELPRQRSVGGDLRTAVHGGDGEQ